MQRSVTLILLLFSWSLTTSAQKHLSSTAKAVKPARAPEIGQTGVIIDESLSVLRVSPSLFAEPIHRMQRGRRVQIQGVAESDGVKFFKVNAPPSSSGWVQADAVFGRFRAGDEERCAILIQAMEGVDQMEAAHQFLTLYPDSKFRPTILLLFGDLLEETAV